jgi:hypothetical protein
MCINKLAAFSNQTWIQSQTKTHKSQFIGLFLEFGVRVLKYQSLKSLLLVIAKL